jgi:hypothetical protein
VVKNPSCQPSLKNDAGTLELICHKGVRIGPFDPSLPPEYCTTVNASEDGLYFPTRANHYGLGMSVYVTTDFRPDSPLNSTFVGVIVRIDKLESDTRGIAIHVLSPVIGGGQLISSQRK